MLQIPQDSKKDIAPEQDATKRLDAHMKMRWLMEYK